MDFQFFSGCLYVIKIEFACSRMDIACVDHTRPKSLDPNGNSWLVSISVCTFTFSGDSWKVSIHNCCGMSIGNCGTWIMKTQH